MGRGRNCLQSSLSVRQPKLTVQLCSYSFLYPTFKEHFPHAGPSLSWCLSVGQLVLSGVCWGCHRCLQLNLQWPFSIHLAPWVLTTPGWPASSNQSLSLWNLNSKPLKSGISLPHPCYWLNRPNVAFKIRCTWFNPPLHYDSLGW